MPAIKVSCPGWWTYTMAAPFFLSEGDGGIPGAGMHRAGAGGSPGLSVMYALQGFEAASKGQQWKLLEYATVR